MNNKIKIGIIDDGFPNLRSGFRIAEFNWLIENTENTEVFYSYGNYEYILNQYCQFYPQNKDKIHHLSELINNPDKYHYFDMFYAVFLHNASDFLYYFNYYKKPFVFVMYPSDRVALNSSATDEQLKRVFSSPYFQKVIVTQKVWYDYIVSKNFIPKEKIEFIYGGISNIDIYQGEKKMYQNQKNTFDICFTAHKYANGIKTKGYDTFIKVCKELSKLDDAIRFHVVGGFGPEDIDISEIGNKIKFYGIKHVDFLSSFYSSIDIIISPTIPSEILGGTTGDGFPTISCVDAGLNKVLVFSTDELNNNVYFKDGEDICIISTDIDEIVSRVLYYKNNLDELNRVSLNTQEKFKEVFGLDNQIKKRMDVFNSLI